MTSERRKPQSTDPESYNIGIICALGVEATAVRSSFDRIFDAESRPEVAGDPGAYTFGVMSGCYVVLACIEDVGNTQAAQVVSHMERSFKSIELCLLIGICGIVPKAGGQELLLGDVVISEGVLHYTQGHLHPNGHLANGVIAKPSQWLIRQLRLLHQPHGQSQFREIVHQNLRKLMQDEIIKQAGYTYPGRVHDVLYKAEYLHKHRREYCENCLNDKFCKRAKETSCGELCDSKEAQIDRVRILALKQDNTNSDSHFFSDSTASSPWHLDAAVVPEIHLGTVASGGVVLKDGKIRDLVAQQNNVMAFEMEAIGVWCANRAVVIKAGCDYADSHKNKRWQHWASMTAAACAKAFLKEVQMGIAHTAKHEVEDTSVATLPTQNESLASIDRYIQGVLNPPRHSHVQGMSLLSHSDARRLVCQASELDQATPRRGVTVYLMSARRQMQHIGAQGRDRASDHRYLRYARDYIDHAAASTGNDEFESARVKLYELFINIIAKRLQAESAVLDENSQARFRQRLDIQRRVFGHYLTGETELLAREYQRQIRGMENDLSD